MQHYGTFSDDFHVSVSLGTELELPNNRETLLHFFERIKKQYPSMKNFYTREKAEVILEEDKDQDSYRWASVDFKRIGTGFVNPSTLETAREQQAFVLDLVPYALGVSPLDCETLNLIFGFHYLYRGNHNLLVAETLGLPPAFEGIIDNPGVKVLSNDPSLTFAVDESCRLQCRLHIEPRTSAYHVRTGEFPEEQLSVFLTARRFGSLDNDQTFVSVLSDLYGIAAQVMDNHVIDQILRPLQQAIAIK